MNPHDARPRRRLLALCTAALAGWALAAARPARATSVEPIITARAVEANGSAVFTPRASSGVLLIGDSMMRVGVGPTLRQGLINRFGPPVELKAKASTGLSRPDFYDWPRAAREFLAAGNYKTVVMMIGANDCQAIDERGKVYRFGTTEWNKVYAQRVSAMADLMCEGGRKAYWLSLPPMREPGFNRRIHQLTELTRSTLARKPCVQWIPTDSVLTAGGRFATHVKDGARRVKVREADGIHMTGSAGTLIGKVLGDAMAR